MPVNEENDQLRKMQKYVFSMIEGSRSRSSEDLLTLEFLDKQGGKQQVVDEDNESEGDGANSSNISQVSEKIITASVGTVNNIRTLFSPKSPGGLDHEHASDSQGALSANSVNAVSCDPNFNHAPKQHDHEVLNTRSYNLRSESSIKKRKAINTNFEIDKTQIEMPNQSECEKLEALGGEDILSPEHTDSPGSCKRYKMDATTEENRTVLDLRSVVEISKRVKDLKLEKDNDLKTLKCEMQKEMKKEVDKLERHFKKEAEESVQKAVTMQEETIKKLEAELKSQKAKVHRLEDVLYFNSQITQDVVRRLDQMEISNAKRMAILTGLSFSEKKKDLILQLKRLFQDELHMHIGIEDAYRLGEGVIPPIVIIFETAGDKHAIFSAKKALGRIKGDKGASVYLNDYLPAPMNEKKRRERDITKEYKADKDDKTELTNVKGGLKVGTELYRKKVSAPGPTDLLDISPEDFDEVMKIQVLKGPQIKVKDSYFQGYVLDTDNHEKIRQGYLKIRLLHARAKHVVCAYCVPHGAKQHAHDYDDDEDHGVGRILLKELRRNDVTNRAVFIVRYCGKEKLNQQRYGAYLSAATQAMEKYPYNKIAKAKQFLRSSDEIERSGGDAKNKRRYVYQEPSPEGASKSKDNDESSKGLYPLFRSPAMSQP